MSLLESTQVAAGATMAAGVRPTRHSPRIAYIFSFPLNYSRVPHERTGSDLDFFCPDACSGNGRASVGR